jgi:hypothetical protein
MRSLLILILLIMLLSIPGVAQESTKGVRGDPEAIAEAEAMVGSMGGMEIWGRSMRTA